MCGICGVVHRDPAYPVDGRRLVAMRESLVHRGPDDAGLYVAPGVGLGSRRLSILDLSEQGHMPMSTPDGRYWITYNGEVYNYRQLRADLEGQGQWFRSNTDTEVILSLYASEGPGMLERLNGMFAIAIWDSRERVLFLARDRLGVKPLYYTHSASALYFASEEKALFSVTPPRFDASTWPELLCFRYVAGDNTPYEGIKRLLPGHYMIWKDGETRSRRWWHLGERAAARRGASPRKARAWFEETFEDAVRLRRISDVPIGVLLSGGLDSSCVAASLAAQAGAGAASFTIRFPEPLYDEGPLAQEVVDRFGLSSNERQIAPEELLPLLLEASSLNDGPLPHGNEAHLLALARCARSKVTVLLSGEGADETLGGYVRYQPLRFPRLANVAQSFLPAVASALHLNSRWVKLGRFLALGSLDRVALFNACDTLPSDLESIGLGRDLVFPFRESVMAEARAVYPREPVRQAMYSDQHTFLCSILDRNDRMTMGASIECRVPFLDYRLVEGLTALPSAAFFDRSGGKCLLRQTVGVRLPESVRTARKWGFGVPWDSYLRDIPELRQLVRSLPDTEPVADGPFQSGKVRDLVNRFLAGDNSQYMLVRQILMVGLWYRACVTEPRAVPVAG